MAKLNYLRRHLATPQIDTQPSKNCFQSMCSFISFMGGQHSTLGTTVYIPVGEKTFPLSFMSCDLMIADYF